MAYRLINEVTSYLPHAQDMTAAERLILMLIADRAHEQTREAWPGGTIGWDLQRLAGMSATGFREALQRLAHRGMEVRVQRGVDKHGQPLFAYRGVQTTYRLPALLPKGDGQASPSEKGDVQAPKGDGQAPEGDGQASESRRPGVALSFSPSGPSKPLTDDGTSRTATPREATADEQPQPGAEPHHSVGRSHPPTDELDSPAKTAALATMRAALAGKRRADTRHWRVGTAPVGPRNELYRPEAAAEAMAMLATIDDNIPHTEGIPQ